MERFDKFRLTQEDIEQGIKDFFTQLLIEARRQKSGAKTLEDLSSTEPTVVYTIGQPGAGKTTLGRLILEEYKEREECIIEVNSDKIATFHRYYDDLIELLPDECYTLSRQFVRPAEPTIYGTIRNNKLNLFQEICLCKGEKDYDDMQSYRDSGYGIEIDIMAVDKYESFLSCIERDIKLLELGFSPRPVARANHDRMYEPMAQELIEISKRKLATRANVFVRGKTLMKPERVYTTGDTTYSSPQEAVLCERAKERRRLFENPQNYLQRIANAKEKIMLMIDSETLRENYLRDLAQLEKEFLSELAFDRSH